MTAVSVPEPHLRRTRDGYGHARMPRSASEPEPEHIDRVAYGRFRNVYLYITEACQLGASTATWANGWTGRSRCRLPQIIDTLATWRRLGGSKLTILGGEPTLHPDYCAAIRAAEPARLRARHHDHQRPGPGAAKFRQLEPDDFAYVQVSLDGGSRSLARRHPRSGHLRHGAGDHGRADQARLRHPHHLHGQPGQPR